MADPAPLLTASASAALAALAERDLRAEWGLRPIINASGTMTVLGASIMVPEAVAAMAAVAGQFVEIEALHRLAGEAIAELTGAEAGFATASCASAITLSVAATLTGERLLAIERLPDTTGLKREVLVQLGHLVGYGASLQQTIELSGARVVPVGTISGSRDYQLEQAIGPQTACAVFVVSHMTVQHGLIGLEAFCRICHAQGVPVIVDAASEYDLRGFLQRGADLVTYSGHKFLGGPTSGMVAGRRDLVRAAALQNRGIGRGMKVGKETLAGLVGALRAWQRRDAAAVRRQEDAALALWQQALQGCTGLQARIIPDPTGNPLNRLRVEVRPESGWTARRLADALAAGNPPVMVRDYQTDLGFFDLDPCNLHAGEAQQVAAQLRLRLQTQGRASGCPGQSDVLK